MAIRIVFVPIDCGFKSPLSFGEGWGGTSKLVRNVFGGFASFGKRVRNVFWRFCKFREARPEHFLEVSQVSGSMPAFPDAPQEICKGAKKRVRRASRNLRNEQKRSGHPSGERDQTEKGKKENQRILSNPLAEFGK